MFFYLESLLYFCKNIVLLIFATADIKIKHFNPHTPTNISLTLKLIMSTIFYQFFIFHQMIVLK